MTRPKASKRLRDNGLSLVCGALFLIVLIGQAFAGQAEYNDRELGVGAEQLSLGQYLMSSSFAVDVAENWQSEYLQFFLYILLTVWLVQRGSPESKQVGDVGSQSDRQQRVGRYAEAGSPSWAARDGWRLAIYSRSLGLVMGVIFLASWAAQSVSGWAAYNAEQLSTRQDPIVWSECLTGGDFWSRTLQNWQSELLAVGSMVIFAVFLRQRGSPESKPVGAPHQETAETG